MARESDREGKLTTTGGAAGSGGETTARLQPATIIRDKIIARLSDAFANGVLEVEEFERRVTVAQRSDSVGEVNALIGDLPASGPSGTTAAQPTTRTLVPRAQVQASGTVLSIMGGAQRQGGWAVPRHLRVVTFMGGAQLDLREARLPEGVVEVSVMAVMGGVEIIVPPNLAVEASGSAIMGGFEHVARAPTEPDPAAPLLRVSGLAMMGGVHIEMRLPGESSAEARRRRRKEQKALAKAR